jgi:hypothetical protein
MSSLIGSSGATGQMSGNRMSGQSSGQMANRSAGMGKTPKGYEKFQQFSPEQMELFKSLFGHLMPDSFLSKLAGGDEETFNQIEGPALKQFSGLQGNLASRFSGNMGGGNGQGALSSRNSSGFQNTSNQAASDFASQLQSQRQGLQSQAIRDLLGMGNQLLGQQSFGYTPKQKSGWQDFLSSLGGGLGQGLGSLPGLFF